MLTIAVASVFGAIAQLLFKAGLNPSLNIIKIGTGFGLYGISFIIYLLALRSLPLTTGYSLIALSYLWVMILSVLFLDESFSICKIVGALGLIVSVRLMV
jgi:drug/metabolite transporter (DMT)-like permease